MADDTGFNKYLYREFASTRRPDVNISGMHYLWHSSRSIVIHELYPKSKMHFKLIPRVGAPPRVPANFVDLYTLLTSREVGKRDAERILREMKEDAEKWIQEEALPEMIDRHHFKWNFWMGFKAAPSYQYLHMHILSDDLTGPGMKKNEHFFSFHPEHGEFIHIDEVLSWFEIVPERFKDNVRQLQRLQVMKNDGRLAERYRELPLDCYYKDGGVECRFETWDVTKMKEHLEAHWEERKAEAERREKLRQEFEKRYGRMRSANSGGANDGMEVEETAIGELVARDA